MYKSFINELIRICQSNSNKKILNDITNLYKMYTPICLEKIINDEISKNFEMSKLSVIKNGDTPYYKYNLFTSNNFDVFDIKWQKDSFSKIHDHPDNGCIVYMYNQGNLTESNFIKLNKGQLKFTSNKNITHGDIGYKIGDKYLHQIKCNIYSETLHIYIPGNFKMKCYTFV